MLESLLHNHLQDASCLACGYHGSIPLFDGGKQPLATLAWPRNAQESKDLPRYSLNFMRCLHCGHIYNQDFEYQQVPYVKHPNLMYNRSQIWNKHLQGIAQRLRNRLPSAPTIIEVGCGEGGFLKILAETFQAGTFIGFDPNSTGHAQHEGLHLYPELFIPEIHLKQFQPDLILSRHVLEHLMDPLAFIQNLALFSSYYGLDPFLFFEVPCVDRLLEYGRLEDLYYEHNSHFTTRSFTTMLKRVDCNVDFIEKGYNSEVIYGLLQLEPMPLISETLEQTERFRALSRVAQSEIPKQFQNLIETGHPVVLWGGTGKGAAFIHHFQLSPFSKKIRVVDSDHAKVGTFVPGTDLLIESSEILFKLTPAVIIITAQWRAEDICIEIRKLKIQYQKILIEHKGVLLNFETQNHPYCSEMP